MSTPESARGKRETPPEIGHAVSSRAPSIGSDWDVAESGQRALLNILEDFAAEKRALEGGQRAMLNILDDFNAEKARMEGAQRAVLNILEDSQTEKTQLEAAQGAMVNILGDFSEEKDRLEETQRAVLNILDDFETEKSKVELANQQLGSEIEERKRTDEALKASEERLQMAVEAAQFGVWDLDILKDEVIRSLRHDQIFGYESLQPTWGVEIAERHIVPEDLPRFRASFVEAFKSNNFFMECRILRPENQSIRWICAQGRVSRDPEGKPIRMMGVVSDITASKEALEELERRREELSQSNLEMTAANKELEAFSYSVSHDLRAPLRTIDGFSLALLEDYADKLDAEGKKHLERVRAATQRMGTLIDDMLNLSRVTRASMRMEKTNISDVAAAVMEELKKTQPERQVEFRIEKGLEATVDSHLLRIILENLLGNAWKFTSKRVEARIEFGRNSNNGSSAFFVRDDGAGFDPAYADRLFGAFQRLHAMSEFPGTGVGLATVQRIIHRHGGRIWAESSVGHGATFYFTLAKTSS